ncbi:hypothetical protein ETI06_05855 [Macrococcoides goetzii]|nr:hypothetical protein [Macrococcus goetzii]TDM49997.1 hypothetical protein ETI06_05855 [Macrococcus goetzii]
MDDQLMNDINAYLNNVNVPSYFPLDENERRKALYEASLEILDEYPNLTLSPRLVVLQAFYNAEGEEEGIAMMHRQGLSDYTVKDVKAVLKRSILSPFVTRIIDRINEEEKGSASGRVARLI